MNCKKLLWSTPRIYLRPLLFLLYVNDMNQAVDCDLFLHADDSYLAYQHKDIK